MIEYQVADHVANVTINRPERRNALNRSAHDELERIWNDLEGRKDARVIILTGAGDKAFCAGHDMKDADEITNLAYWIDAMPDGFGHIALRKTLMIPIIARVNGFALGGGLEMVLGADLAIASETAELGFVEPRMGRLPLDGGIVRLARELPRKAAMEILLTGRRFSAQHAKQLGIVNDVVPFDELDDAVDDLVGELLECAPLSLQAIKELVLQGEGLAAREARWLALPRLMQCLQSRDADEGVEAFREGRHPVWSGE